ncbi:hypothetical protein ODS41_06245 [Pyrobaculum sp. 3827-6]|uniref:hypothetical protein n=1 Tax=Pyrobaculum sp. 3827-6 TaxID=2983604 RepID=UPI0021D97BD3|nr:hypothetical protein [Pyrobaculum sp. 3827-6]MCU7787515.1 hypothetical protein [Pyrobaculum sp. 3827-6]
MPSVSYGGINTEEINIENIASLLKFLHDLLEKWWGCIYKRLPERSKKWLSRIWPRDAGDCLEAVSLLRRGYSVVRDERIIAELGSVYRRIEEVFRGLKSDLSDFRRWIVLLNEMGIIAEYLGGYWKDSFEQRLREIRRFYKIDCGRSVRCAAPERCLFLYVVCSDKSARSRIVRDLKGIASRGTTWSELAAYLIGDDVPNSYRELIGDIYAVCSNRGVNRYAGNNGGLSK